MCLCNSRQNLAIASTESWRESFHLARQHDFFIIYQMCSNGFYFMSLICPNSFRCRSNTEHDDINLFKGTIGGDSARWWGFGTIHSESWGNGENSTSLPMGIGGGRFCALLTSDVCVSLLFSDRTGNQLIWLLNLSKLMNFDDVTSDN